jgi:hypothetical protein
VAMRGCALGLTGRRRMALLAGLIGALLPAQVLAHTENGEGFSRIRARGGQLSYELTLDYFELARVVRIRARRGASAAELRLELGRSRAELEAYLGARLRVSLDALACSGQLAALDVERRLERDYARLQLEYSCPGARAGGLAVQYGLLFDDSDSAHRNLARFESEDGAGQHVFTATERELRLGSTSLPGQLLRFAQLGTEHIAGGYDHLLFLAALLLGTASLAAVLQVLSVFTLAHSATLAAAVLGFARVSPAIVEPLIALSIAYVALDPAQSTAPRSRLGAVFGFGLVHGMGFAGSLELSGARGWHTALPLLSFNLGIELGQAALALLGFAALRQLRRHSWSSAAQGAAQLAILGVGLIWYFERLG